MKKVSFLDTKIARWALPAGIVVLAAVTIVAGQATKKPNAAITQLETNNQLNQKSELPASTATPKVTVNGKKIPTGQNGITEVPYSGGQAQVEISDGHATITATNSDQGGDTSNQQSNKVQIDLDSATNGGTNTGRTRVFGSSISSDKGSKSISSTHVFSTGSDHVSITQK